MLEQMNQELQGQGQAVNFLAINSTGDEAFQALLTAQCAFPLFQDVAAVDAWGLFGGGGRPSSSPSG